MNNFTFATWNANSVMSSASYAGKLLASENIKIFGLSEHWLNNSNLHFLQSIHKDYQSYGVVARDLVNDQRITISRGGVALTWHRSLGSDVTTLDVDSDRICGIHYNVCQIDIIFIQVYVPCS